MNLLEIAELSYNNIFPLPRDKNAINLVEFIQTAKMEYASAMFIYKQEMALIDGIFQMPSNLLTEVELPVENNELDIKGLKYLSVFSGDLWLQNVGGIDCECKYVKTNINLAQLLCHDDSAGDNIHYYYVQGKKIKFLKKPHKDNITIVFANMGSDLDERTLEVDEYIGSKVRDKLEQRYGKRMQPADVTNNNNVNI